MFSAETIEIAIGLVFFYLLLSLLMTTINEIISGTLSLRGRQLQKGVGQMLGKYYGQQFFNHPLIGELGTSKWKPIRYLQHHLPSYMRAATFSQVVVDVIKQEIATKRDIAKKLVNSGGNGLGIESGNQEATATPSIEDIQQMSLSQLNAFIKQQQSSKEMVASGQENTGQTAPEPAPFSEAVTIDLHQLLDTIKSMGFPEKTLSIILNLAKSAEGDIDLFRKKLEEWFDAKMERVTGWYIRQIRWITLVLSFVIAIAMNADTFFIVQKLGMDSEARTTIVSTATQYASAVAPLFENRVAPADSDPGAAQPAIAGRADSADSHPILRLDSLMMKVDTLLNKDIKYASQTLGLGWSELTQPTNPDYCDCSQSIWCYLKKVAGLLLTAIAMSLGAPFWFDMLKKLISIRSAGINPDETAKDAKKTVG